MTGGEQKKHLGSNEGTDGSGAQASDPRHLIRL